VKCRARFCIEGFNFANFVLHEVQGCFKQTRQGQESLSTEITDKKNTYGVLELHITVKRLKTTPLKLKIKQIIKIQDR